MKNTKTPKTPFYVIQHFLSPLACEEIVCALDFIEPDVDINTDRALKSIKRHDRCESMIFERLQPFVPNIEQYYNIKYKGTEVIDFEWFPEGSVGEARCENSHFTPAKKWLRNRDRDLSAILFLVDHQDQTPFDSEFEVSGGKLEFAQHDFGFVPERGTLIMFPSVPHFINATAEVIAGDLYQARFHIGAMAPFLYNPQDFPGDYTNWFSHLSY